MKHNEEERNTCSSRRLGKQQASPSQFIDQRIIRKMNAVFAKQYNYRIMLEDKKAEFDRLYSKIEALECGIARITGNIMEIESILDSELGSEAIGERNAAFNNPAESS